MEISSRFAGTTLKPFTAALDWQRMTNYAAATGDANPFYLDDEREGGIVAPPMFAVALTWPIIERVWEFIENPEFPLEVLSTIVHYTEHLQFHKPMRPGGSLEIRGKVAAIVPHRSGTVATLAFDSFDESGKAVFTEHIGAMLRGVHCTDDGGGAEALPVAPAASSESPVFEKMIAVDPLAPYIYDGCTGIRFPIHTSPAFAHQVGLPGIICQGTATLATAVRELVNLETGGDPAAIKSLSCRFSGMVVPGTGITFRVLERRHGEGVFFDVLNSSGHKAIANGWAGIEI